MFSRICSRRATDFLILLLVVSLLISFQIRCDLSLQGYSKSSKSSSNSQNAAAIFLQNPADAFKAKPQLTIQRKPVLNVSCSDDPLDDLCKYGLTGFPERPMTIRQARLCDPDMQVVLPKSKELICDTDYTCIRCRKKQIEQVESLNAAFNSPRRVEERGDRLERVFRKNRPVIVSSVNYGQIYLLLNLANSCVANDVFDIREYMWIIPTDEKAYKVLKKFGFHAEPVGWIRDLKVRISENYRGGANIGGHSLINSVTVFAANFILSLDYTVLVMDVDFVFIRDIFPFLKKAAVRRDILGMYSPRHDAYGWVHLEIFSILEEHRRYMNSGFLYIKATRKSKVFMKTLENLTYLKKGSDQIMWNSVLRHYKFQQIAQRVLPRTLYFTMWGHATEKQGYNSSLVKCVHVVSVNKAKRLIQLDFWYFNDSYPFYDQEVMDYVNNMHLIGGGVQVEARMKQQEQEKLIQKLKEAQKSKMDRKIGNEREYPLSKSSQVSQDIERSKKEGDGDIKHEKSTNDESNNEGTNIIRGSTQSPISDDSKLISKDSSHA